MSSQDLYSMLGMPADTALERLRHAYEGAVDAAANRHDWARAKALSAAFDLLPASTRLAIYPGRERNARRWDDAAEASAAGARGSSAQPRVRWRVVFLSVITVTLVALVGLAAIHQLLRNREAGSPVALPTAPQLARSGSARLVVPRSPGPQPSPSLTVVIRIWTDPGTGNIGRTIGGLPLWTTPASIPLDRAGRAVMRCSAVGTNGPEPWSRIDPRIAFTCPPGSGPEYRGNP
jgi:hypothetical protein